MSSKVKILNLVSLTKQFREPTGLLTVLDAVNLSLYAGEVVLLEGPSGSGKTTLLQIAGCLLRADSGQVRLLDRELNAATDHTRTLARQLHLGFAFQNFHLLDALTVRENVALALQFKRQPVDIQRIDKTLSSLGLSNKIRKRPSELSGGEKQRVALARSLVGRPTLLLADEPTSQLDAQTAHTVAELMRITVKEIGCAALITTHDTRLHPIADRLCTLVEGKLHE